MADDKNGREAQARNEERRQRERALEAALERGDEPEPPAEPPEIAELERELETVEFPATGTQVVAAVGDGTVTDDDATYAVADLIPDAEAETFDSPSDVLARVRRPTVASAMKRILETVDELPNAEFSRTQRDAYERTFVELAAIDVVDENEEVAGVADWVVSRIREKGSIPGSREVRREAAKVCRANGYQVSNDEWLGV